MSVYGRCPLARGYQCLCVARTMTQVSPYGMCPLTEGGRCSVCVWPGPIDSVSVNMLERCPLALMGGIFFAS